MGAIFGQLPTIRLGMTVKVALESMLLTYAIEYDVRLKNQS